MSPVDWSEHRQPNMVPPVPLRVFLWVILVEIVITVTVVATFGNPRSSSAAA